MSWRVMVWLSVLVGKSWCVPVDGAAVRVAVACALVFWNTARAVKCSAEARAVEQRHGQQKVITVKRNTTS